MSRKFVLSYSQPTWANGRVVAGTCWYVSHAPGDGGVDFGYTRDASAAKPVGLRAMHAFVRTHGSRAVCREVA